MTIRRMMMMAPALMYMPLGYPRDAHLQPWASKWDGTVGNVQRGPGIWRTGTLVTRPALMQLVHTWRRLGAPSTSARTFCTLGFHRRLVRTWECDTDMPNDGFLAHSSQTEAIRPWHLVHLGNRTQEG